MEKIEGKINYSLWWGAEGFIELSFQGVQRHAVVFLSFRLHA